MLALTRVLLACVTLLLATGGVHAQALNGAFVGTRDVVFNEGDSISVNSGNFFLSAKALLTHTAEGKNFGVSGTTFSGTVPDLVDREAADIAAMTPTAGVKCELTVLIGTNSLANWPGASDAAAMADFDTQLFAYYDTMKAATGCATGGITILPNGANAQLAVFNARRAIVNAAMRATVGTHLDFVVDFASDPTMGVDNSFALHAADWQDSTHPSVLGYTFLTPYYVTALNNR